MKELNQLLNHADDKSKDQILKNGIRQMFDLELRQDIVRSLENDYKIKRTHPGKDKPSKSKILSIRRFMGVAASLLLLISVFYLMNSQDNRVEKAERFAYLEVINHPGLLKGEGNVESSKNQAIKSFNQEDWSVAIKEFEALPEQNAESKFYLGMAKFYAKDYSGAIAELDSEVLQNSAFQQEIHWFLGLAFILNNQEDEGLQILKKIKPGDWNYNKAKDLVN